MDRLAMDALPSHGTLTVRAARDAYLAENGFTLEGYDAKWTQASFLFIDFVVPNTPPHRWGIRLHDLHHVATGYGTDLAGEGEISAWEIAAGLRGLNVYVGGIVCLGALVGLCFAPGRVTRAWKLGRRARTLWSRGESARSYEELLGLTVAELCAYIGVSPVGAGTTQRRLHRRSPPKATMARNTPIATPSSSL